MQTQEFVAMQQVALASEYMEKLQKVKILAYAEERAILQQVYFDADTMNGDEFIQTHCTMEAKHAAFFRIEESMKLHGRI